ELASSVAVLIIIAREFLVTSVRLVASGEGKVIAANIWGKLKTVSQMVVIILVLALRAFADLGFLPALTAYTGIVSSVGIWVVAAVTVMSGITYLVDNIQYINTTK
ncbi:MAG: CDP-diacylglycerol--glycerol-3-phosphate 3-phosphatidyltransferase, partial [Oscillospiraceae bacterium]|nr:CDP-diacylglycerol--glycerol-3-phosphate 3-phosphatidyltransferase [Oscillospiraceae bacterium]